MIKKEFIVLENDLQEILSLRNNEENQSLLRKQTKTFIENIITQLMLSHGDNLFWGYVFNYIQKEVSFELPAPMGVTFKANEFVLMINPNKFMDHWTAENITAIVIHEGYHLLMNHLTIYQKAVGFKKFNSQNAHLVNISLDCEINQHITGLPKEGVTLESFAQLVKIPVSKIKPKAGSIYYIDLAFKSQENNSQNNNNSNNNNGGQEEDQSQNNNNSSSENGNQDQSQANNIDTHEGWNNGKKDSSSYISPEEALKNLMNTAKKDVSYKTGGRGSVSDNIEKLLEKLNAPSQIPWQKLIGKTMGKQVYGKRETINRLNRKSPYSIMKKGKLPDRIAPIVVAMDTSGSVSEKELMFFYNEIYILSKKKHIPIEIIQFDSEVKSVQAIKNPKDLKFKATGFGGTTFQSVFNYLSENKYSRETMLFIFTDGGGESHIDTKQLHKITWIVTDENKLSVDDNKYPVYKLNSEKI